MVLCCVGLYNRGLLPVLRGADADVQKISGRIRVAPKVELSAQQKEEIEERNRKRSRPGSWEPFEPARDRTMVLDNNCRTMDDPESEARKILLS